MSKIIVHNLSGVRDDEALNLVARVVQNGRVSDQGRSYCYCTTFEDAASKLAVYAKRNKSGDSFSVERWGLSS